ncbi:MAG: MATE family efflux transporter [Lentisphaeria bacterium]|nr:MATE family efflux transporter [Lentisphaeria bacterium]
MSSRKYQMDMCHGPLLGKMVWFTLPLILSSILQMAFHAIDMIVIGHFAPHESLAAVGSVGSINSLMVNVFSGLSVGTNVLVARYFGANDPKRIRHCVHTSMALALFGGIGLLLLGQVIATPLLRLVGTPDNVMSEASIYLRILFLAIPFLLFFNFGYAVLRAVGDTMRPMFFLIIAGAVNVVLNLFFVLVCGMHASGVALATLISHALSALFIYFALARNNTAIRLIWQYIRIDWRQFREILKIGLPAGVQSSCYSVSNMLIQASINTFGSLAIAGSAAAGTIEGFVGISSGACHQAALAFTAQNYGGKQLKRIKRSIFLAAGLSAACAMVLGFTLLLFDTELLQIVSSDPGVIEWGLRRMLVMFTTAWMMCVMDSLSGSLRGLGYSMTSTVSTLAGVCGFRIVWVLFVFPLHPTFEMLFSSYPVSWMMVAVFNASALCYIWKYKMIPLSRSWRP